MHLHVDAEISQNDGRHSETTRQRLELSVAEGA